MTALARAALTCFLNDRDHVNPFHGWRIEILDGPMLFSRGVWQDMCEAAAEARLAYLRTVGGWGDDGYWVCKS